jgi:hypothetical protein
MRAPVLALLLLAPAGAGAHPTGPDAGERIFRQGVLPSGRPLRGEREAGVRVEGEAAACASCHRRSGLGSWEGQTVIPPIIGRYLFRAGARNVEDPTAPHVLGYIPNRAAYTEASLARAIREGRDPSGRALSYVMPRYRLDDAGMAALVAYLRALGSGPARGDTGEALHFATVVTPDADPVARQGMLEVLRQFFADRNAGYRGPAPPMKSTRGVMYRVTRRWELHVWELSGPPETWESQLRRHLAETPVLAVVSGIGGRTWAPVHRFCEEEAVPCLFPNVDLPVDAERDFYSVYFSRGVLLEARLEARRLREERERHDLRRIVQVARPGGVGEAAARALAAAEVGLPVETRILPGSGAGGDLATALQGLGEHDALVLWLRPADLRALPAAAPQAGLVLASGLLGGMEDAPLPLAWRAVTHLAYPLDLPEIRRVRMDFPLGWLRVRHVPLVAERVQVDTYLACAILSETLGHMLDSFVPEYLVERIEEIVSHRLVNAHYPRLGLAPGQRFASKGGYIVRLSGGAGTAVSADGPGTVP